MFSFLEKLRKKKKIVDIRRKRKKLKKRRSIDKKKIQNSDKAVFEIKKAFPIDEHSAIICGKVKTGSFKTKDHLEVFDCHSNKVKLNAVIRKITTTLVEVNKINSGFETDMLIGNITDADGEILPGDIASKVLIFKVTK